MSSKPDAELARLTADGNDQAFSAIVDRYRRELEALARRMRPNGCADDLVQQTFLNAFAALRGGTEVRHIRGWLYRILRNEVVRTSRPGIVEIALDPMSVATEPLEELSQRRMLAHDALTSIAALPHRQRQVLIASALNGESRADVAKSIAVSEGAVRQLMHRARAALRAAAGAILPSPLANWLAGLRSGPAPQAPEVILGAGAGAGAAAGVAAKLGAILAAGVLATGLVGSHLISPSHHTRVVHVRSKRTAEKPPTPVRSRSRTRRGTAHVAPVTAGSERHSDRAQPRAAAAARTPAVSDRRPNGERERGRERGRGRRQQDSARGEDDHQGRGGGGPGTSRSAGSEAKSNGRNRDGTSGGQSDGRGSGQTGSSSSNDSIRTSRGKSS